MSVSSTVYIGWFSPHEVYVDIAIVASRRLGKCVHGFEFWVAHHFGWVGWYVWKSGVGCFVSPASDGAVWGIKV